MRNTIIFSTSIVLSGLACIPAALALPVTGALNGPSRTVSESQIQQVHSPHRHRDYYAPRRYPSYPRDYPYTYSLLHLYSSFGHYGHHFGGDFGAHYFDGHGAYFGDHYFYSHDYHH